MSHPFLGNLLAASLTDDFAETSQTIVDSETVRIERIVSSGGCSDPGFWYDQDEDEWVAVIAGEGVIEFQDDDSRVHLCPGDHLHIPAHRRHRVEWTRPEVPTIWIAVFSPPPRSAGC